MALSEATSNSPRPRPDWLEAPATCQPAWFRRAIASSAPGSGTHSCGVLTNSSLSTLIVPSRSRMTSFMAGRCGVLLGKARQVGDPVHGLVQGSQQPEAVQPQVRLF